ncbi:type II toxin-antitoxin system HicA family toxin [Candidatus Electronema sp. PJ]|uniref:type II toxin-antitoxin system HicA family toxin n=1 Tax=Candidatus Electronema sp. PJ TaxID=3401572 RepID=UPI003AA8A135
MKAVSGKRFGRLLEEKGWELQRVTIGHHLYIKRGSLIRLSLPVRGNDLLKIGLQKHLMKVVARLGQAAASPEQVAEQNVAPS